MIQKNIKRMMVLIVLYIQAIGIDIKEKKYFWVEDYIKNYIDNKFDELKQLEKEYFLNKHN